MTEVERVAWQALEGVIDPELGFSIVGLGLVYGVAIKESDQIEVVMTMTSVTCPLQEHFRAEITKAIGVAMPEYHLQLEFTFVPPWSPEKATAAVKEQFALLGIPLTR